ncbi:Rha family transcriptional regulator [Lysinibacillus antri]|uniref:Phage regulatory protein n=1 Tax=Lysinibacillus antri TaxID=2498145 RepID=A0A3S0P675_9BACI|nr:Rha family transcriptional regulator [Lysinibacillus antri]RUL56495.1 phage regulatory protein [Lysinibacillus antri]
MNRLPRNISSVEVAEMVERRHDQVMRDIRNIIDQLGDHTFVESYFIESSYTNTQNKELPCFLLTKKGCELYGTRMTGEKGTQFAVKYIERFNEMEVQITEQNNLPQDPVELALQTSLKNYQEIRSIRNDIDFLKDSMRIDGKQELALKEQGKAKVFEVLGGYDSAAYNKMGKKVFAKLWGDFKRHFLLPRSMELAKKDFDEGVRFIAMWRPDTTMMMEIDTCNRQAQLKLVK